MYIVATSMHHAIIQTREIEPGLFVNRKRVGIGSQRDEASMDSVPIFDIPARVGA